MISSSIEYGLPREVLPKANKYEQNNNNKMNPHSKTLNFKQ